MNAWFLLAQNLPKVSQDEIFSENIFQIFIRSFNPLASGGAKGYRHPVVLTFVFLLLL